MKKLLDDEKEKLLTYIKKEPEMNLFLIGDLENFGFHSNEVSFYASEKNGVWDCVLLKFYDNYILYSQNVNYDVDQVVEFLKGRDIDCISGKDELIQKLEPYFPKYVNQSTFMCRCNKVQTLGVSLGADVKLVKLGEKDIPQIMNLYLLIDEFAKTYRGENKQEKESNAIRSNIEIGGLYYGIFEKGELVSIAATSGANSMGAMVVGVATHPDHRGKGYASVVVEKVCEESFKEGKQFLCLFFDNPAAGRIYHMIGFKDIGKYSLFR